MDGDRHVGAAARIAAAMGEPARMRMLECLMDGRARTSTELAVTAEVSASTASVHLARLKETGLVEVRVQGKHRYYSLSGAEVARALEALSVLAGEERPGFQPRTPIRLQAARTCYDHMAGALGVALHDRILDAGWLWPDPGAGETAYALTEDGAKALVHLGLDLDAAQAARRRFAFGCLDWSERRPHLGGALGAALLSLALDKGWVERELDDRALEITDKGRRELGRRFGVTLDV
jgi:DNA-binding transcriptional ArsR family regulator